MLKIMQYSTKSFQTFLNLLARFHMIFNILNIGSEWQTFGAVKYNGLRPDHNDSRKPFIFRYLLAGANKITDLYVIGPSVR